MWAFLCVNLEEQKKSETMVWSRISDRYAGMHWSASKESSLNKFRISVFLCEKRN